MMQSYSSISAANIGHRGGIMSGSSSSNVLQKDVAVALGLSKESLARAQGLEVEALMELQRLKMAAKVAQEVHEAERAAALKDMVVHKFMLQALAQQVTLMAGSISNLKQTIHVLTGSFGVQLVHQRQQDCVLATAGAMAEAAHVCIRGLQRKLADAGARPQQLISDLADAQLTVQQQSDTIRQQASKMQDNAKHSQQLIMRIAALEGRVRIISTQQGHDAAELVRLRGVLRQMDALQQSAAASEEALEDESWQLRRKLAAAEATSTALQQQVHALQHENQQLRSSASAADTSTPARDQVQQLQQQLAEAQQQLAAAQQRADEEAVQRQELETALQQVQDQLQEAGSDQSNWQQQHLSMLAQNKQQEVAHATSEALRQGLVESLNLLLQEHSQLGLQHSQLQQQLEQVKGQLTWQDTMLASAQAQAEQGHQRAQLLAKHLPGNSTCDSALAWLPQQVQKVMQAVLPAAQDESQNFWTGSSVGSAWVPLPASSQPQQQQPQAQVAQQAQQQHHHHHAAAVKADQHGGAPGPRRGQRDSRRVSYDVSNRRHRSTRSSTSSTS